MAQVTFVTNTKGTPEWCADFLSREHLMPFPARLDPSQFVDQNGVLVKANGAAAQAATSVTVDALLAPLPLGALLRFLPGAGKLAVLTAAAAEGATSITVEALPTAIADNDEARYSPDNRRTILDGTLVGRTTAERLANTPFGAAADTDDEFYIVAFTVDDALVNPDIELVRPGTVIKENYLPDWTTISANANLLAKLRGVYRCITGVN